MTNEQKQKILENDLSDLKAGDWVYISSEGYDEVVEINKLSPFSIVTTSEEFMFNGLSVNNRKRPILFRSKEAMLLYFQTIEEEKPKRIERIATWTVYFLNKSGEVCTRHFDSEGLAKAASFMIPKNEGWKFLETKDHTEQIEVDA